jgi:hypothetical protein
MNVDIKSFNKDKEEAIKNAADAEWNWDTWETWNGALCGEGEASLCGGESEEEFAERLSKAIWTANGGYCEVNINQTNLDYVPCESYSLSQDAYIRIMAE